MLRLLRLDCMISAEEKRLISFLVYGIYLLCMIHLHPPFSIPIPSPVTDLPATGLFLGPSSAHNSAHVAKYIPPDTAAKLYRNKERLSQPMQLAKCLTRLFALLTTLPPAQDDAGHHCPPCSHSGIQFLLNGL